MVAAENDAIKGAKVGGMADVVRDAPLALAEQGHQVSVIIPDYADYVNCYPAKQLATFSLPFAGNIEQVTLTELFIDGCDDVAKQGESAKTKQGLVRQFVISHDIFTAQGLGRVYLDDVNERPFAADASKYALFNAAVVEALLQNHIERPDVLHLHDWHSALVTVLLAYAERYQTLNSLCTVYTVHNLALQGIRPLQGDDSSLEHWFPALSYDGQVISDPRYPHCINPMRAAINLADKVHLVSPSYAQEVLLSSNADQGIYGGEGLEVDLQNAKQEKRLFGILNGCQYKSDACVSNKQTRNFSQLLNTAQHELLIWLSRSAQLSSSHYLANEKIKNWLSKSEFSGPLITSVGRLTDQKMLLLRKSSVNFDNANKRSLLADLLNKLADSNGRMIILGSGDSSIADEFTRLMAEHENFLFLNGYAQESSDNLYQMGDLFLMPSSFEPCGISQMLALRAGQPCLVHAVGGLKDTIKHLENGFCFSGNNFAEQQTQLIEVFEQALALFTEKSKRWKSIVACAKQSHFSWQESVAAYVRDLYH